MFKPVEHQSSLQDDVLFHIVCKHGKESWKKSSIVNADDDNVNGAQTCLYFDTLLEHIDMTSLWRTSWEMEQAALSSPTPTQLTIFYIVSSYEAALCANRSMCIHLPQGSIAISLDGSMTASVGHPWKTSELPCAIVRADCWTGVWSYGIFPVEERFWIK